MGYTHYWYRKGAFDVAAWTRFTEDVSRILDLTTVPLDEVTVDSTMVVLNGVGDHGHETFHIRCKPSAEDLRRAAEIYRGRLFDFCKTARKPYDEVVTACLVAAKAAFGSEITVNSDGSDDEWARGRALYEAATQHPAPRVVVEEFHA